MDIRSFFKPVTNKVEASGNSIKSSNGNRPSSSNKHRTTDKSSRSQIKRNVEVISSDSDVEETTSVESSVSKVKRGNTSGENSRTKKQKKSPDTKVESGLCADDNRNKPKSFVNLAKLGNERKKGKGSSNSDSEDDCVIMATPEQEVRKKKKPRIHVMNSDSEEELPNVKATKANSELKLKPVTVTDIFSRTVKQSKVEHPIRSEKIVQKEKTNSSKKKKKTEVGIHEDRNFEKTLIDLDDDDDLFFGNEDILEKTIEEALQKESIEKYDAMGHEKANNPSRTNDSEGKIGIIESSTSKAEKSSNKRTLENEEKSNDNINKAKKSKLEHTDSGFDDQGRYEKKKYCAMQYQSYLNRSGPKHHGSKEIPKEKPDCLANICFLRTGVLDSLESSEFDDLIKRHGGRVVQSVSKKVNFIVVGEDAGPAKLEKAEKYGIPTMDENELLDMILQKSGMPKKFTTSTISSFEDAGINDSFISSTSEEIDKGESNSVFSRDDKVRNEPTEMIQDFNLSKIVDNGAMIKQVVPEVTDLTNTKQSTGKLEKADQSMQSAEQSTLQDSNENEESKVCLSEKYKPTDLKQIVGQQLSNSNMNKLKNWLEHWHENSKLRKQKKITQPRPWDKNNDGGYFKCALLSGPPGVGKTTTATLVAQSLGFDIVEFNASDTRSKKLLKEEVASALSIENISFIRKKSSGNKRVLLMDEVDGMAGNEDRGGMQELINLIKLSKIPVICMCNDRNHQKMRSLANYCFDLRFEKPRMQQILGFVMSICCKEGIKVDPKLATEVINGTTCDIRQTLNQISMLANLETDLNLEEVQRAAKSSKKDTPLGPWQVCRMVFTDQKDMTLIDKSRLFFHDYSMGPLFVQENYVNVRPCCDSKDVLKQVALAAAAISMGATIDKKIREANNWSLLDTQAMYSSVLPGHYMNGEFVRAIDFPGWLGKNSKRNKIKRITNELASHTKIQTSGGVLAMNLDYSKALTRAILNPLRKKGLDGVRSAVEIMKSYHLLREDLDNLVELCTGPKQKSLMDGIDSKVKAAFTRLYNKEVPTFSHSVNAGISKKKTTSVYDDDQLDDDENDEHSDTEETVENDNLVKAKKSKSSIQKESSKASTSKSTSKAKASSSKSTSNPKAKGKK